MAKRIAYLLPHSELAGGERVILDLCAGLDKNRFLPFVILPRDAGLAALFRAANVPVGVLPFRRDLIGGYPPAFRPATVGKIGALLSEWKINFLHLNDSYLSLLGGLAARRLDIPVGLTAHGPWDSHFFFQDILNRWALSRIWVPTEAVGAALRRRRILPAGMIHRIPFGVDTEKFSSKDSSPVRQRLGIPAEAVVVTRIARFDTVKDYPTLIRAAERIVSARKNIHFLALGDTVLDIGTETQKHKREILKLLEERPVLKKNFHLAGHRDDVASYLQASDIVVSSSMSESFGLNLLEAMSMERAVVSTKTGGPSEIVDDGVTGRLVPPADPAALADAVIDLIDNPQKRSLMGRAGRKRAVEFFSLNRFVKSMEEEYENSLHRP